MARNSGKYTTAIVFVLLGVVLLLFTTDLVEDVDFWTVVAAFFVLLGAWALVSSRGRNLTGPVLVIVIAGVFLLRDFGYLPDGFIGTWWPAVFILLGVLLLIGRSRRGRWSTSRSGSGEFTSVSIFGGDSQRVGSDEFRGGEVVAVFGGPTIDLREAAVADPPAVLEIVAIFGGAELRVPEDWTVKTETVSVFGGVEDNRHHPGGAETPDLVVTGISIFGGVEIHD